MHTPHTPHKLPAPVLRALADLRCALDECQDQIWGGAAYDIEFGNNSAAVERELLALEAEHKQVKREQTVQEIRKNRAPRKHIPARREKVSLAPSPVSTIVPTPKSSLGNQLVRAPQEGPSTWLMTFEF